MGNGRVRAAGVAMAMQGSCISNVDVGSAVLKLSDDGTYNLIIGAADMGTGCDTILAQIAAECMDCPLESVAVFGADTDVTGKAVERACEELKETIRAIGAEMMDCPLDEVVFEGSQVRRLHSQQAVSLADLSYRAQTSSCRAAQASATQAHSSPISPPPFMVGMAEIELDRLTGHVTVLDYMAVVDCGTPINEALARIQAEGGIVQGIGMTLTENVTYNAKGRPFESSLMQYKLPTRLDMGRLRVEFEPSYEPTGPFGAKSIGEVVINTPPPAIAHAIYRATGIWHRELPITPEHIAMSQAELEL